MLKEWLLSFFKNKKKSCYCSVCSSNVEVFLPLSDYFISQWKKYGFEHIETGEMTPLETYTCPNCHASDRERLYALWIKQQIQQKLFFKGMRLIHFAPEISLGKWLKQLDFFDYSTADLLMPEADYQIDITNMSFNDQQFDFFICSHVLEHVDNDDKAISELYRILKTNGCGILMVPIVTDLEHTLEDITITDEAERWRLFGQDDHVRLYSHNDYVQKLQTHGFIVEQLGQDYFSTSTFQALGLKSTSILYIVRRYENN